MLGQQVGLWNRFLICRTIFMDTQVNPIFLISQPRSGSTLLQYMLAAHPQIATCTEPWIQLPLTYMLRKHGVATEYHHATCVEGCCAFAEDMPGGKKQFDKYLGRFIGEIYGAYASVKNAIYFLDKTPRYYLIIDRLVELFPDARFVFLLRNPIAVFNSIVKTRIEGDYSRLRYCQQDLLRAPRLILDAITAYPNKSQAVHYEDLVSTPENTLRILCSFLGIDFDRSLLDYGQYYSPGELGDPVTIRQHHTVQKDYAYRWHSELQAEPAAYYAHQYLEDLGDETFLQLGYNPKDIRKHLPARQTRITMTWDQLMRPYYEWSLWERFTFVWIIAGKRAAFRSILNNSFLNKSFDPLITDISQITLRRNR